MEQAKLSLRDKPAARWGALAIISLTMFFAYMFVDVLSPVKTLVETELGWDSTAGVNSSSTSSLVSSSWQGSSSIRWGYASPPFLRVA